MDKASFASPKDYVQATANEKGRAISASVMQDAVRRAGKPGQAFVISADTIVEVEGRIMEKPADRDDAIRMLTALSGRSSQVHTAVSIRHLSLAPGRCALLAESHFVETTSVHFASLTSRIIEAYVDSGEPMYVY